MNDCLDHVRGPHCDLARFVEAGARDDIWGIKGVPLGLEGQRRHLSRLQLGLDGVDRGGEEREEIEQERFVRV